MDSRVSFAVSLKDAPGDIKRQRRFRSRDRGGAGPLRLPVELRLSLFPSRRSPDKEKDKSSWLGVSVVDCEACGWLRAMHPGDQRKPGFSRYDDGWVTNETSSPLTDTRMPLVAQYGCRRRNVHSDGWVQLIRNSLVGESGQVVCWRKVTPLAFHWTNLIIFVATLARAWVFRSSSTVWRRWLRF